MRCVALPAMLLTLSSLGKSDTGETNNPDAVFCNSVTEAVNLILKPKITVLPGARGNDKGMTIPHHGALYIISPSRPALAGEIAAALCEETPNCALVCASPESMGAVSLGIPTKTLVTSD